MAAHNLLTQSIGQSDDTCGDVAAPVRKERDRLIHIVKVREPPESLVLIGKLVVYASVKLILVVLFVSNLREIVGCSGLRRQWIVVQHRKCRRIDSVYRN